MADKNAKMELFPEFPPVSTSDWIRKIEQDLKGTPIDKLVWKAFKGIDILPFYREEDLDDKSYLQSFPGEFPFVRGCKNVSDEWEIRQDILCDNIENSNANALDALNNGSTSLGFIIPETLNLNEKGFQRLLKGIHLDCISINFICHTRTWEILGFLENEIREKGIDPSRIRGSFDLDPLGYLSTQGNFNNPEKVEFMFVAEMIRRASGLFPGLRVIGINPFIFHNAGASLIQDLGFGLAMISEYLDQLTKTGLSPFSIASAMQMNFATGSSYFMEIARLRSARLLFANLVKAWGVNDEKALKLYIHCKTSEWTQAIYDPHVNMLRSTTQAMSAVIGGADSISVTPFDCAFRKPSRFSERMARNTQIILKEEAYLNKVTDPASGSYYIESLTDCVCRHAWNLFLQVEDQGGYLNAFKTGYIQKLIHETSSARDLNLANRKEILVGINQYINSSEKLQDDFDPEIAFPAVKTKGQFIAPPLGQYRASGAFEEIRMKTEQTKKGIPKVFLLSFGKPGQARARAEFSANFFASGGFEIIPDYPSGNIPDGIAYAKKIKAEIVVFCSSDEEYLLISPVILKELGKDIIPVIAGHPSEIIEELKSRGILNYIHLKSDVPEELKKYQELLGI